MNKNITGKEMFIAMMFLIIYIIVITILLDKKINDNERSIATFTDNQQQPIHKYEPFSTYTIDQDSLTLLVLQYDIGDTVQWNIRGVIKNISIHKKYGTWYTIEDNFGNDYRIKEATLLESNETFYACTNDSIIFEADTIDYRMQGYLDSNNILTIYDPNIIVKYDTLNWNNKKPGK